MVEVCESVRELVGAIAVFGGVRASAMAKRLPSAYALRLREHEASEIGQRRWAELMEQRVA